MSSSAREGRAAFLLCCSAFYVYSIKNYSFYFVGLTILPNFQLIICEMYCVNG